MISFKQFLMEAPLDNMEDNELQDMLQHDCAFFLEESKKKGFLIRGINSKKRSMFASVPHPKDPEFEGVPFWKMDTRQDRQPKDIDLETHKMLDRWFNDHFGFKARSQALFCMGSSERGVKSTNQYGTPHIIMPVGEFKYAWSPNVIDLYGNVAGVDWSRDYENPDKEVEPEDMIDEYMTTKLYKGNKLDEAVQGRAEIMVGCSKYYAFEYDQRKLLETLLGIK